MHDSKYDGVLTCPVSGSKNCYVVLEIPEVPVFCNVLYETRSEALAAPCGQMVLAYCPDSGHLFNASFDARLLDYSPSYENSLHFSPRFQHFAESLADRLIQTYAIRNKQVIDIGCGQGDFLELLCQRGNNTGIGFDPSYDEAQITTPANRGFSVVQDLYTEKYADRSADLITCRHVLEHIEDPRSFVDTIRKTIGDRAGTTVYCEVPNALFILKDLAVWDLIYEHVSYFSRASLSKLFREQGFQVMSAYPHFADQYLGIEAQPVHRHTKAIGDVDGGVHFNVGSNSGSTTESDVETDELAELVGLVASFSDRYEEKVALWSRILDDVAAKQQRAVVWGAGSKGVTILNILDSRDRIEFAVDINPRKQGKFVAGSGQQIVDPDALTDYRPDVVLLMNEVYRSEVEQLLSNKGLFPTILVA